jgi:inner membrane transporter RhtA
VRAREERQAVSLAFAVVLIVIAMTSIQLGAAIAKTMFGRVGAIGAVTLRVSVAAILLVAALRPWRTRRTRAQWRLVVVYGLALGAMNALFYAALQTIPLGVAVAIELAGPLAVALHGSRRVVDLVWIALAIAGLVTLLPVGGSDLEPSGVTFALGAGACWALYIVVGRKAGAEHGLQTTAAGMAIAALLVLPFGIAEAGMGLLDPELLPFAVGAAVLSSALPYCLEMLALPRMPAATFGTLMSAEPVFGALAGLLFLDERLNALQWLAIAAIMLASAGTTLTASRR